MMNTIKKIAVFGCVVACASLAVSPLSAMDEDKEVSLVDGTPETDIIPLHSGTIHKCLRKKYETQRSLEQLRDLLCFDCLIGRSDEETVQEEMGGEFLAIKGALETLVKRAVAEENFSVDFFEGLIAENGYRPMLLGPARLATSWIQRMYDVANTQLREYQKACREQRHLLERKLSIVRSFHQRNKSQELPHGKSLSSSREELNIMALMTKTKLDHDNASIETFASDALLEVRMELKMELKREPSLLVGLAGSVFQKSITQKSWAHQKNDTPDSTSSPESSSSEDN